jgi:hypothetical protein
MGKFITNTILHMARSQNSFIKKLKADKKRKKQTEKMQKRLEKSKSKKEEGDEGKKTEFVMGFVDEHGNVVTELPDEDNNELE